MSRREAANHVKAGGRHFLLRLPPSDALCNIITCGRPQTTNSKSHRQQIACTTRRDAANNDFVCEHIISSFEECARVLCNVPPWVLHRASNAPENVAACHWVLHAKAVRSESSRTNVSMLLNKTSIQKHGRNVRSRNSSVGLSIKEIPKKVASFKELAPDQSMPWRSIGPGSGTGKFCWA